MSESTAYLVVASTPIPDKTEEAQYYVSQVMPYLIKAGGEVISRYGAIEQLGGEGGPKSIAAMKFPNAQAIRDALSTDEFKALSILRDKAFSRVDQMLCTSL